MMEIRETFVLVVVGRFQMEEKPVKGSGNTNTLNQDLKFEV